MSQSFDPPHPPVQAAEGTPREAFGRSAHPVLALAAYADELIAGSRVAVFGDATLPLPRELIERGARLVHVYDLDATRIADATATGQVRSLYYGSLHDEGDIGVRDGAFDLVYVPYLSFTRRPHDLLALVRRVLAVSGAAVIAMPNIDTPHAAATAGPGRLGYYELYDAISRHFPRVRMVGQVPFVGYAMAEFAAGADDLEPTIDSSLVAQEREPGWFIALASVRPVHVESFMLVETPATDEAEAEIDRAEGLADLAGPEPVDARAIAAGAAGAHAQAVAQWERERDEARAALQQERRARDQDRSAASRTEHRLAALEHELTVARERLGNVGAQLEAETQRRNAVETENETLRHGPELARQRERIAQLEAKLVSLAAEREREVASFRERAASLEAKLGSARAERERELASLREHAASLEADLAAVRADRERELASLREHAASLEADLAAVRADRERSLSALSERAASLEAELASATAQRERSLTALQERASALEAELAAVQADNERTVTALRDRAESLERQLGAVAGERESDVTALETLLKERGRLIADLRAEIARRDYLVREMVVMGVPAASPTTPTSPDNGGGGHVVSHTPPSIDAAESAQGVSVAFAGFGALAPESGQATVDTTAELNENDPKELRDRLDSLAREACRREADLIAANWRIAQLERQLSQVQR